MLLVIILLQRSNSNIEIVLVIVLVIIVMEKVVLLDIFCVYRYLTGIYEISFPLLLLLLLSLALQ